VRRRLRLTCWRMGFVEKWPAGPLFGSEKSGGPSCWAAARHKSFRRRRLRKTPLAFFSRNPRAGHSSAGPRTGTSGLGWGADTFISTYKDNRKEATQILLEDSTVATVLIALARMGVCWSGEPKELYEAIVEFTGHTLGPRWPKTISKFGSELRRIAPQLLLHGESPSILIGEAATASSP
jgi:hypothetical protein